MSCNKNKSWKWYFLSSCLLFLITSCGGGGGSSSASPENPPVVQGKFIDAPVGGLEYYLTGSSEPKLTLPDGTFEYVDGQAIRFQVGGVILGECLAKQMITPVDLVRTIAGHESATINDSLVTKIVQFLLGVNSSTDPSLVISAETRQAFKDQHFDLREEGSSVANIVSNVLPGASVPTELLAQAHLKTSIGRIFAGDYEGTYTGNTTLGPVNGIWTIHIDESWLATGTMSEGGGLLLFGSLKENGLFDIAAPGLLFCTGEIIDTSTGQMEAACIDSFNGQVRLVGRKK